MTTLLATVLLAAGAASQPAPKPFLVQLLDNPLMLIALMVMMLYFVLLRPKSTQDKKRQEMLKQLKKGDRIQTIGGILGTVVEARETEVVVKVDETSNTKLRFARNAIHRVIEEERQPPK